MCHYYSVASAIITICVASVVITDCVASDVITICVSSVVITICVASVVVCVDSHCSCRQSLLLTSDSAVLSHSSKHLLKPFPLRLPAPSYSNPSQAVGLNVN